MKPEAQIKALAKLDGFIEIGEKPFGKHELRWMGLHKNAGCPSEWWDLPLYLTSYDAIIPLIQKQSRAIRSCIFIRCGGDGIETPAQLCEALLRATNRWTE